MYLMPFNTIANKYEKITAALAGAKESVEYLLKVGGIAESKALPILNEKQQPFASYCFECVDEKWGYDEHGSHPGYVCDYDQRSTDDIWNALPKEVRDNPVPFLRELHAIAKDESNYLEFIRKGIELAHEAAVEGGSSYMNPPSAL